MRTPLPKRRMRARENPWADLRDLRAQDPAVRPPWAAAARALGSAFGSDPRPGLFLERGCLRALNSSAKRLMKPGPDSDALLAGLRQCLLTGIVPPVMRFRLSGREFGVEFHPPRARSAMEPRICFLVQLRGIATEVGELLSRREIQVVGWLARGRTNSQVAALLGISVETVRKHVSSALSKTGASTRAELAWMALKLETAP